MCGIVGWITHRPVADSNEILRNMADAIAHRGPDDEGIYIDLLDSGRGEIALAHKRLSIIDLGGGHQPMIDSDTGTVLVFNGEIYNFPELRSELSALGHRFETHSDTEVLLRSYIEWGEQSVHRLRGMFAFAIWDRIRERLLLARDHFGKKPLFIFQKYDSLLFGSEIKSLLRHPGVHAKIDQNGLWEYFAYRYVPGPLTLFEGVRKLDPGTYAVWENGKLDVRRYYTPPDQRPRDENDAPSDIVDKFLATLDEAVRVRMVSDVPFGAFLSGGIDSSAVVALMARHSDYPVKSFSVGFAESKYSELPYCREIAEQFRTDHHELVVSETDIMECLPSLVRYRDAPVAEPSDIPIFLLAKEARKSVKMVLTGEGSDELLGGYPKHIYERYVKYYHILPALFRRALLQPLINALPYRYYRVETALRSISLEDPNERFPRWFGVLSDKERAGLLDLPSPAEGKMGGIQFSADPAASELRRILFFDQTSWLPDNLLERGDRMTMAASLEARMPFVDAKLAAFVSALPDDYRIRGRKTKWILREAMKQIIPERILTRPKVGFRVPVNEWFRGLMRDYILQHLTGPDSKTRVYYNQRQLDRVLHDHISGRRNHEKLLWSLLNLELWHREYL